MMGNITLKSTRRESCRAKGVPLDKIPNLRSHDTTNPPPSKEITESPAATNLSNRHRPDRPLLKWR